MRISVNNLEIEVSGQRPLIEELREMGIQVPSMCYGPERGERRGEYDDFARDGNIKHRPSCMVCMVKDVQSGQMLPSCSTMPYEGMQIETDSDEVLQMRRLSLELLLSDHRADCEAACTMVCKRGIDVAGVIRLYDMGKMDEARKLLHNVSCEDCPAPCERGCRRITVDSAVNIREILASLHPTPGGGVVASQVAPTLWRGAGGTVPFNSRQGRFTDKEKERMKVTYDQPSRCLHCACDGRADCQLRDLATRAGIKVSRYGVRSSLPFKEQITITDRLVYEPSKCIRCGLCVYNTQDGFTFERRGFDMRVVIPEESKKNVSDEIAQLCPTGALTLRDE